jgi:hypothetical protein
MLVQLLCGFYQVEDRLEQCVVLVLHAILWCRYVYSFVEYQLFNYSSHSSGKMAGCPTGAVYSVCRLCSGQRCRQVSTTCLTCLLEAECG